VIDLSSFDMIIITVSQRLHRFRKLHAHMNVNAGAGAQATLERGVAPWWPTLEPVPVPQLHT
jgi:hypothetical protein